MSYTPGKIVQLSGERPLYALTEDGEVWKLCAGHNSDGLWREYWVRVEAEFQPGTTGGGR